MFLGLCVQPMLYVRDDISLRLVEWMELLKIMKYDRVIVYVISVHENIRKVKKNRHATFSFSSQTHMLL